MLISGLALSGQLFAQNQDSTMMTMGKRTQIPPFSPSSSYRTFSIGINGGMLTPYTVFGGSNDYKTPRESFGYGANIKQQLLPSFGLQADFLAGKVRGSNQLANTTMGYTPGTSYDTKINYALSLSGVFTLANINWLHQQNAIQPYFSAGAGYMSYYPVSTAANGAQTAIGRQKELFIPIGVGFKFLLSRGINLDLGYSVAFVNDDNLDQYHFGSVNDRFSYAHAGLEFAIGSKTKPQMSAYNPVAAMYRDYTAKDQMLMDKNQMLQSSLDAQVAANARTKAQLDQMTRDLADDDADGVANKYDKCPGTPAGVIVDGSGCALPERKPDVKVYVTQEDKQVVSEAVKNLEFDLGKATIREHSYASLDKLAALLQAKNFNLKLAGYTDNTGSVALNKRLSADRANAVKQYLVTRGVSDSKIDAQGYGQSNPISTNKTAEGRQQNRRVEFSIY